MARRVWLVGHPTSVVPRWAHPPQPAYTRLDVDERRRRLLELGAELFARHGYEELSMARIAREAGISKALLYHYFPSKQAYFAATLEQAAEELARGDPAGPGAAAGRAARPRASTPTSAGSSATWAPTTS